MKLLRVQYAGGDDSGGDAGSRWLFLVTRRGRIVVVAVTLLIELAGVSEGGGGRYEDGVCGAKVLIQRADVLWDDELNDMVKYGDLFW